MHYFFVRLIKYNDWANKLIINAIQENEIEDKQILENISHLLNVEGIWIKRIDNNKGTDYELNKIHSVDQLHKLRIETSNQWMDYLRNLHIEHLYQTFNYKNSKGEEHNSVLADVIIHVVNHASYHRGKIAKRFRDLDIKPPSTDFIYFSRDNEYEFPIKSE